MTRLARASFGAFCLMLSAALLAFLLTAADADLYFRIQKAEGIDAGVSDEVLREYDGKLADFLGGKDWALDSAPLFNEREIAHMVDVRRLFDYARNGCQAAFAIGGVLIAELVLRSHDWKRMLMRACLYGGGLLALLLGALAAWALIDFGGAFDLMHKALFSNDLWRLDPDTDLMIRMLPERFFMRMAGILALRCLPAALLVPVAAFVLPRVDWSRQARVRRIFSQNREDDHDLIREARQRKGK